MSSTFIIVKSTLIHVLKNTSIFKNQQNGILEVAALVDSPNNNLSIRKKLMIICFSPLSSWILFIALLICYFNPYRYVMSIGQISFFNGFVTDVLFSTDYRIILISGVTLLLASFLFNPKFKIEFMLIAILGFLISNSDIHLRNVLLFLPLVILGRLVQHLKLIRCLQAETKKIWSVICALLFLVWIMTTWLTLNSFQFFSDQGIFSNSMNFLRFEFFAASVFAYYFMELLILSIWGHFYCLKLSP